MKIACGQLCSSSSLVHNRRVIIKLIHQSIKSGVSILFLPEASDYISRDAGHSTLLASKTHAQFLQPIQHELQQVNRNARVPLQVAIGIHEPGLTGAKVRNTQLWLDHDGLIQQRYQKLHLFDINIPDGPILKESNSVERGESVLAPFSTKSSGAYDWKIGFAICYDIRFGELATKLRQQGANILTYPSAFTTTTGKSHWLALGKARAIDSQCYVVMAAQCGEHDTAADDPDNSTAKKRVSYGQSVVIDPWGDVVARGKAFDEDLSTDVDGEGDYYQLVIAELDEALVEKVRTNLPVFSHRREDVYGATSGRRPSKGIFC